jgi:hypothetical protein
MMAVPLPLSVKARQRGSGPDSAKAGGGYPVAVPAGSLSRRVACLVLAQGLSNRNA